MAYLQTLVLYLLAASAAAALKNKFNLISLEEVRRISFAAPPPSEGRIVGGQPVQPGELPYMCSIQNFGRSMCGCSIIAQNYAMTAAHCTLALGCNTDPQIAAGSVNKTVGLFFDIDEVIDHPRFDPTTLDYDVSILHTTTPIQGTNIAPVQLACMDEVINDGQELLVAGFGRITEDGSESDILFKTEVFKVDQTQCMLAYPPIVITDAMICASGPTSDACMGDSGGPLVQQYQTSNIQVGIVSFSLGCADPLYPGVYASIANEGIRSFIETIAGV